MSLPVFSRPIKVTINNFSLNRKNGFTLIEVLIVVLIISIVITFATLNMGQLLQNRKTSAIADQMTATIQLAQQQAILQPAILGMRIDKNSYSFYQWKTQVNEMGQWQRLESDRFLKPQELPSQIKLQLIKPSVANNALPQIIFQSSGDVTPFLIDILKDNQGQRVFIDDAGLIQQIAVTK